MVHYALCWYIEVCWVLVRAVLSRFCLLARDLGASIRQRATVHKDAVSLSLYTYGIRRLHRMSQAGCRKDSSSSI